MDDLDNLSDRELKALGLKRTKAKKLDIKEEYKREREFINNKMKTLSTGRNIYL